MVYPQRWRDAIHYNKYYNYHNYNQVYNNHKWKMVCPQRWGDGTLLITNFPKR
jgi:hypothetical protein